MRKTFTSTLRSTAIYGFGNISAKIIGFVLIPLYTDPSILAPELYGRLGLMETVMQFVITFFSFGLITGIQLKYFDRKDTFDRKRTLFSILVFFAIVIAVLVAIIFLFQRDVALLLTKDDSQTQLLFLFCACILPEILSIFLLTVVRLEEKPTLFVVVNVLKLCVHMSLTIWFVVFKKMELEGVYLAQLISYLPLFIGLAPFIYKHIKIGFEWKVVFGLLRFSMPFTYGASFSFFGNVVLMVLLREMKSEIAVGILSLGQRMANITRVLVVNSIELSLSPLMLKMEESQETRKTYGKFMLHFSILVGSIVLLTSLFGKHILLLGNKGEALMPAYLIIPILSFAIYMEFIKGIASIGIAKMLRSTYVGRGSIFQTLITLIVSGALLKPFGFFAIPIGMLCGQTFFFFYIMAKSQRYYFVPYDFSKLWMLSISLLVLLIASMGLDHWIDNLLWNTLLKVGLVGVGAIAIWMAGYYNKNEIQYLKDVVKKLRRKFSPN